MYNKILLYACIAIGVICILHMGATAFYWYDAIFGFDKVMHTLGGIFLALLGGALFLKHMEGLSARDSFITLVLFVVVVGLFWEYYEYAVQTFIKGVHLADIPDSIGDLVFDMVGGIIGSYFVILLKKRYNGR